VAIRVIPIMTTADFKAIADTVPKQPGVYRFIGPDDNILYVGKAKVLRNRVASYFGERKDRLHRTRIMVRNAARIEFTIVETEADALLLENALIKTHQPRYNVNHQEGALSPGVHHPQGGSRRKLLLWSLHKQGPPEDNSGPHQATLPSQDLHPKLKTAGH